MARMNKGSGEQKPRIHWEEKIEHGLLYRRVQGSGMPWRLMCLPDNCDPFWAEFESLKHSQENRAWLARELESYSGMDERGFIAGFWKARRIEAEDSALKNYRARKIKEGELLSDKLRQARIATIQNARVERERAQA